MSHREGEHKHGLERTSIRDRYGKQGFNYDKSESLREELREKYSHFDKYGNDKRKRRKLIDEAVKKEEENG